MRHPLRHGRKVLVRVAVAGVTAVLLTIASADPGYADTPTPTPSSTPTPSNTPTPSTAPTTPTAPATKSAAASPTASPIEPTAGATPGSGSGRGDERLGADPGTGDAVSSNSVTVPVKEPAIVFDRPVTRVDSLKNPSLTGSIVPVRDGVQVDIELLRHGRFHKIDDARTDAAGRFALSLSYGRGSLASYRIRAAYRVPNQTRVVASSSHRFRRIAVLNSVVSRTTAGDVATTYHPGCPVGPSRLRTVRMNYYGSDKKMHRGVLIVRSDLTGEIRHAFGHSLQVRFPITRMKNPNAYGGNDPRQMAADNSSGFNCRKVVGNPYRMSPHSYGIAIDVNTRQNPYRDVTGKWWPANGRKYIDRTPRRLGMLNAKSTLVRTLGKDGFFWGGRWYPGRDYQHFQY
jgi:D-alanyl-D-alanine carboxypeptidase